MVRAKLPAASPTPAQLEALADVAEKYAGSGKGHVTTRQNIQFHFVPEAEAETALRMLADVGHHDEGSVRPLRAQLDVLPVRRRREGRAVRSDAVRRGARAPPAARPVLVDAAAQAQAVARRLLRHRLLAGVHQRPRLPRAATQDGEPASSSSPAAGCRRCAQRGIVVEEFVPVDRGARGRRRGRARVPPHRQPQQQGEGAPQVGDRQDRRRRRSSPSTSSRARDDPRRGRRAAACCRSRRRRRAARPLAQVAPLERPGYAAWAADQRARRRSRPGSRRSIDPPVLGDITAAQLRALAPLCRRSTARARSALTNEQNLVLRWVPDLRGCPRCTASSWRIGLAKAGANTLADVTGCPGASSCKLAVTASQGLGARADRACSIAGPISWRGAGASTSRSPAARTAAASTTSRASASRAACASSTAGRRRSTSSTSAAASPPTGRVRPPRRQGPGAPRAADARASGRDVQRREAAGGDAAGVLHPHRAGQGDGQDQGPHRDGRHHRDSRRTSSTSGTARRSSWSRWKASAPPEHLRRLR